MYAGIQSGKLWLGKVWGNAFNKGLVLLFQLPEKDLPVPAVLQPEDHRHIQCSNTFFFNLEGGNPVQRNPGGIASFYQHIINFWEPGEQQQTKQHDADIFPWTLFSKKLQNKQEKPEQVICNCSKSCFAERQIKSFDVKYVSLYYDLTV